MKHWLIFGLLMLLSAPAFAQESAPVIRYDSVPNALKLPPNTYFGEATGVAVNSKKHVFVLSRGNTTGPAFGAAAAQLLEFGPDGRYLRPIQLVRSSGAPPAAHARGRRQDVRRGRLHA